MIRRRWVRVLTMGGDVDGLRDLIRRRHSAESFRDGSSLSDDEIRSLVDDAIRAPSSFNIQHWRFVAVRHDEDRQRLCETAYGQQQVVEAAVTFIVLGDLRAAEKLADRLETCVEAGAISPGRAAAWSAAPTAS